MKYAYRFGGHTFHIELVKTSTGYRAVLTGEEFPVEIVKGTGGELTLMIGDYPVTAHHATDGGRRWIFIHGKTFVFELDAARKGSQKEGHGHSAEKVLLAPMPGRIRSVQVSEGDAVTQGQSLFVLEAMKMEVRVKATRSGHMSHVLVTEGQSVERDQALGEID